MRVFIRWLAAAMGLTLLLVGASMSTAQAAPSGASPHGPAAAPSLATATTYYRLQSLATYGGKNVCVTGHGSGAALTVEYCSTSTAQKFRYADVVGGTYPVLSPVSTITTAIDAPTLSGGTTLQLRALNGGSHQGWYYDSLGNQSFNIYMAVNHTLVMSIGSSHPGTVVKINAASGCVCQGLQSWKMYVF